MNVKASFPLLLIISFLLTTLFSCSGKGQEFEKYDFMTVPYSEMEVLDDFFSDVSEDIDIDLNQFYLTPESEFIFSAWEGGGYSFYTFTQDGRLTGHVSPDKEKPWSTRQTVDNEGTIYRFVNFEDNQYGKLMTLDKEGNSEEVMTIRNVWFSDHIEQIEVYDDTFIIVDDFRLRVFRDGEELDIDEEINISSMTVSPDGKLWYIPWNDNEISSFDLKTLKIKTIKTPFANSVISYTDNRLLVMDNQGIAEYQEGKFKGYLTCSDDYPEVIGYYNHDIKKIGNDIYITSWDSKSETDLLIRLRITDRPRKADTRPIIIILVPYHDESTYEFAARTFNRSQKDVKVKVIKMDEYNTSYIQKLNAEILAGSSPDIISLQPLPYEDYIEKGILSDLDPYIKDDQFFQQDEFIPALTAARTERGLYGIAVEFRSNDINFLVKESLMEKYGYSGSYIEIRWDEMLEIAKKERTIDSNGMDVYPFGIPYFEDSGFYLFNEVLVKNDYFIDRKKGELVEDELRKFLKLAYSIFNDDLVKPGIKDFTSQYKAMINGSTLFFNCDYLDFEEFLVQKMNFFDNEPVSFVHPYLSNNQLSLSPVIYGISSQSDYKKHALKFLRALLSKEYQEQMHYYSSVRKDLIWQKMKEVEEYESDGVSWTFSDDDGEVTLDGISIPDEEDYNNFFALYEKFTRIPYKIEPLSNIFEEQAYPFLEGEITEDEYISIVKERVFIYLNE